MPQEHKVKYHKKSNPYITNKELASVCGITEDGIFYHTKKMKSIGVLRRAGGAKGGYWEMVRPIPQH